jgi:hypothetical protein
MSSKLETLTIEQLSNLLSEERKKFIVAIDYGASGSDLEEIRYVIKELEAAIASKNTTSSRHNPEGRSSVA